MKYKKMCVFKCVCGEEALGIHLGAKGVPAWKSLGTTDLDKDNM